MNRIKQKNQKVARRHQRVRAKISGTVKRPRLAVYRSLSHIYAQLIDDTAGKTLVSAKDGELKDKKLTKIEQASAVGKILAAKAQAAKISEAVFDRGRFKYHGRVKALAEGVREGGLKI
jgi:large subunit ribosomal protein L18